MNTATRFRLHDSLGYRLTYTSRLNERRFETMIAPLGLTRLAWCVLCAVEYEGLTRPSEVAAFIGVDRTALSRIIRRMEAAGHLARALDVEDGRGRRLGITEAGRRALERATVAARVNAARFAARMTEEERAVVERVLARIMDEAETPLPGL